MYNVRMLQRNPLFRVQSQHLISLFGIIKIFLFFLQPPDEMGRVQVTEEECVGGEAQGAGLASHCRSVVCPFI